MVVERSTGETCGNYTGLDQAVGNVDRYALLRGPILMALDDAEGRIQVGAASLPRLLIPVAGGPLQYEVKKTSYRFLPYWQVKGSFTCFPMIQDIAGKNMCGKIWTRCSAFHL